MINLLEFVDVVQKFSNGTIGLNEVNLKIEKGEFVYIIGQSGAGKSTFTKLILREYKAKTGKVVVDGLDIKKFKRKKLALHRRKIGVVYQNYRLLSERTAFENVAFAGEVLGLSGREVKKRSKEALVYVGLGERMKHYPHELSGGEQQRVAIARAIANKPSILVADEPTGNLDPLTAIDIMNLFEDINKQGTTVIMATHDENLVQRFPHRTIVISAGEIIRDVKGDANIETLSLY